MKTCTNCSADKDLSKFYRNKRMADGYQPRCKLCMQKINADWYVENRETVLARHRRNVKLLVEQFNKYKETLNCARCPENRPVCLEFHHPDPSQKDFTISDKVRHFSFNRLKKEIDKCIVLCRNCHAVEHVRIKLL